MLNYLTRLFLKLISASGIALIPLSTFPFGYVKFMAIKLFSAFGSGSIEHLLCQRKKLDPMAKHSAPRSKKLSSYVEELENLDREKAEKKAG